MNRWTQLVHYAPCPGDPYKANNTPIYQTATFTQDSIEGGNKYDYSRSGNPTRHVVEQQLAKLEQGKFAFAFNSGMAAITAIIGLLRQGDHIVAGEDLYGGTHRLLAKRLAPRGITFTVVDSTNAAAISTACTAQTRLILIETPSNPLQKIADIRQIADIARQKNILFVVDNTFLSPWLQQPLLLGADIVIHSATKHLSGHSDITAGAVIVNDEKIAEEIAFIQNAEGGALAPFESWLLLRGLKTLGLRIEHQQLVTQQVAFFLKNHSQVKNIYYPGFEDHIGHDIHWRQAKGAGTLISFQLGSLLLARRFIETLKLFTLSVSFGSLNSLVSLPINMSHASLPAEHRHLPQDLIRLSLGIEDADDLISDLAQGFEHIKQCSFVAKTE